MTTPGAARNTSPAPGAIGPSSGALEGITRFHIAAIATQRAKQLQGGARPRVADADGHKSTRIAVMEVLANTVSWEVV